MLINQTILLLDDEVFAAEYLYNNIKKALRKIPNGDKVNVLHTSNLNQFYSLLKQHKPFYILLDIHMPDKSGIEVATDIKKNYKFYGYLTPPIIMFCTAFNNFEHLTKSLSPFQHLHKPVSVERIESLIQEVYYFLSNKRADDNINISIHSHTDKKTIHIPLSSVLYFYSKDKLTIIKTTNNESFSTYQPLSFYHKEHPTILAFTHRAYLIHTYNILGNLNYCTESSIVLNTNETIPISRRMRKNIHLLLSNPN